MLIIRDEQMAIFRRSRLAALVPGVAAYVRQEAPEVMEHASDEEVLAFVRAGCERALAHAIDDAYLLGQYVLFTAWAGADMDAQPWAAAILGDAALSPMGKILALEDHILSNTAEA